jgi:4-amino-4-deoxy-L-arabinose transferase-like glycosyltransferase
MQLKEKYYLYSILLVSLLLKIILAFTLQSAVKSDSVTYHNLAMSILSGEYSLNGKPTAFVVCGYPLFLSAVYFIFGDGQFFVKIIQSLIEVITCYLFFKVSLNFFNTKYSLISLAIFSFLPSNLLFSQTILTESLFGFFSMTVLFLCLKENFLNRVFLIGIFFGCAIMIRSSFSFAILLVPLYLLIERKDLFGKNRLSNAINYSVIFFAGVFLILSPWIIRNKIVMNTFSLATQGGSTLWEGNNPEATGTWNKLMVESNPMFDNPDEVGREKEFYNLAVDFIVNNPAKFFILGVKKLGYLFSSERMIVLYFMDSEAGQTSTEVYRSVNPLILILVNLPYFIVMLTGAWGLLILKEKRFFIYGFILTWMLTIFIFVALARYHYVLIPFFIIGTVNLLVHRKDFFRKISLPMKFAGVIFTIFLIGVWFSEFYLMLR